MNDDDDRFWRVLRFIPDRAARIAAVVVHDGVSANALENAGARRFAQRAQIVIERHRRAVSLPRARERELLG